MNLNATILVPVKKPTNSSAFEKKIGLGGEKKKKRKKERKKLFAYSTYHTVERKKKEGVN